ncbi:16508_t:CDS:2 [Gigaspora margarita]|uniref:16508_t:CDS:1 n=1 Tax=Gigaspora margarita TaxID=4874 RepID=A0ABN7UZ23_GIGMA|nr:16508_t:CDS:2 [Gigaspora margarita]
MNLLILVTLLTIFSSGLASATVNYFDCIVAVIFENGDYSEPNYFAMIYGSTNGITDDGNYNIAGQNLVDLLEAKSITWKAYMENYMDSSQLDIDISNNEVPQYVMYVPNQQENGQGTNLDTTMVWFHTVSSQTNQVAAVLYGTPVKPPSNNQDNTAYNHDSFLATVEQN